MTEVIKKRKRRSDTNHIIYTLECQGMVYVGVTVVDNGSVVKSLQRRWRKHVNRALGEEKTWRLCEAIRAHGADAFVVKVLEKVRGKRAAHARERELVDLMQPCLNTDVRKRRAHVKDM